MHNKKTPLIFLIATAILLFVFLSEALFIYSHERELSVYSFKIAKIFSSQNKTDVAFSVLTKGSGLMIVQNSKKFPWMTQNKQNELRLPDNIEFKHGVNDYIETFSNEDFYSGKYNLSRVFYDLAMLSFEKGYSHFGSRLLGVSMNLDPNLSYWSVELANYYLSEGDKSNARDTINKCVNLDAPKKHCQDFLENNINTDLSEPIGFLKEQIKTYYDSGYR